MALAQDVISSLATLTSTMQRPAVAQWGPLYLALGLFPIQLHLQAASISWPAAARATLDRLTCMQWPAPSSSAWAPMEPFWPRCCCSAWGTCARGLLTRP